MSKHANACGIVVSGTPGTGTITLTTTLATGALQTFLEAFGAVSTVVDVHIVSSAGVLLSVERNATFDGGSPGTLTRGTAETPSSTVSVPAGAEVWVAAPASAGNLWESAALESVAATVTTANVTGVVGQMAELDISGLTADRSFVLPIGAAVNSRCGFRLTAGYTATNISRGLRYQSDTGETLNGATAGVEVSRCGQTHEIMIFKVASPGVWKVDYDGRRTYKVAFSVLSPSITGGALHYPGTWTADVDPGGLYVNSTFDHALVRRAGEYDLSCSYLSHTSAGSMICYGQIARNLAGTPAAIRQTLRSHTTNIDRIGATVAYKNVPLVQGDAVGAGFFHSEAGAKTYAGVYFELSEVLP